MGEGSHGSSEFFAFKDRLFRYLVEKKGFTIFAMEAAWGAGLNVDRYIKGGRGTAKEAVASLGFWTWDVPEVVNLVRWMRDYNAQLGRHSILSFVGVDMQDPMGAVRLPGPLSPFARPRRSHRRARRARMHRTNRLDHRREAGNELPQTGRSDR